MTTQRLFETIPPSGGSSPASTIRRYDQLDGAQGREVLFRPQRYDVSEFGPVRPVVTFAGSEGARHECPMRDVSQNGVAFEWPRDLPVESGAKIQDLLVSFDGHEAYRGEARVGSIRQVGEALVVGASFVESLMNIDDVLHLRDVKAWSGQGADGLRLASRPWRTGGFERFKSLVGEFRLFLDDAEAQLDELEASLPWHVAHGGPESPAHDALVARIRSEFGSEVVRLSNEIDVASRTESESARQALKEYSHRFLHEVLLQAPWMHRALRKPLGYPGDFELMNGLYERTFEGTTLFAKALNLGIVSTPAGEAVRQRKNMIRDRLSALIDSRAGDTSPVRVLSIAAGPAQETFELLRDREEFPVPVEIYLFDQDKLALSYAYGRIKRVLRGPRAEKVRVVYLHDSIKRLLRDPEIFAAHGHFDMVFSCGLFDYLQFPTAVSLSRSFYGTVAPGGTVYIGNMVPENPSRWFMEMHNDWHLTYRTRDELAAIGHAATPNADVRIVDEATGVNPFLAITKS
jgi:hypothetical protein